MSDIDLIAPTPDLIKASERSRVIIDPRKTEVEPSKIVDVLDWALMAEIIWGIPEALRGTQYSVYIIMALAVTIVAMATLPDKMKMAEVEKPGTPLREIVQVGPYMWTEQTKVVNWTPLVDPEDEIKFEEIAENIESLQKGKSDQLFTVTDKDGKTIMRGQWLSPEKVELEYQEMLKKEHPPPTMQERATQLLSKAYQTLKVRKKKIYVAITLGILAAIFYPIIYFYFRVFMEWIGW